MLFDTDVLIWALRGNAKAAQVVDDAGGRSLSVVTYLELLRGARDKREVRQIKSFLADLGFRMLPLTENIGHRACVYMEEYGLSVAMDLGDALIAAAAAEANEPLVTANDKHYAPIRELEIAPFRPSSN